MTYLDTNLLIYALLLLLDLFLELLYRGTVRRGAVGLEDLDIPSGKLAGRRRGSAGIKRILIGKRRNLLLFYFIVGESLLVLLPILAGCGRLKQLSVTWCPLASQRLWFAYHGGTRTVYAPPIFRCMVWL